MAGIFDWKKYNQEKIEDGDKAETMLWSLEHFIYPPRYTWTEWGITHISNKNAFNWKDLNQMTPLSHNISQTIFCPSNTKEHQNIYVINLC
jgi:hypothetical protein